MLTWVLVAQPQESHYNAFFFLGMKVLAFTRLLNTIRCELVFTCQLLQTEHEKSLLKVALLNKGQLLFPINIKLGFQLEVCIQTHETKQM